MKKGMMNMTMKRSVRRHSNHIQSDDDNEDTWQRSGLTAANKKRLEFNNDEVARELEVCRDGDGAGVDDDNCLQNVKQNKGIGDAGSTADL